MNMLNLKDKWIDDFFKEEYLDFTQYPDKDVSAYFKKTGRMNTMDYASYKSPALAKELKVITKMVFTGFRGFTYKSKIVTKLFQMALFLTDSTANTVFDFNKEDLKKDFMEYRESIDEKPVNQLVDNMFFFLTEYYDKREGLDRDIWYLDKLSLAENRLNKAETIKTINFFEIENIANRELAKKYARYQLGGTELSVSTIMNNIALLKQLSNYLKKDFVDYEEKDAVVFEDYIYDLGYSNNSNNKRIAIGVSFFNYLIANNLYEKQNPFIRLKKKPENKTVQSSISDYVISQIFYNLDLATFDIMVMYVINYCTGMRVSDICQLEVDNTFEAKGHYFIKHKVQKMKKFQANIIPEAAYKLIKQQEAIAKKDHPKGKYLFPSRRDEDRPMNAMYYRNAMKKLCSDCKIKNEDGTPYEFKPHAYRHTIATTLLNDYNVDLSIIQLGVLGHQEINMSLCYAERNQPYRERYEKNYVSIDGSIKRISDEMDDVFLETADKLAKSLENMQLPNGMCVYPRRLGVCPHFDACLQCEYFRTSLDYLELHKQQLAVVNRNIPIYEANNWLPNLETAKREKEGLERIIAALERLQKGGDMDASDSA